MRRTPAACTISLMCFAHRFNLDFFEAPVQIDINFKKQLNIRTQWTDIKCKIINQVSDSRIRKGEEERLDLFYLPS